VGRDDRRDRAVPAHGRDRRQIDSSRRRGRSPPTWAGARSTTRGNRSRASSSAVFHSLAQRAGGRGPRPGVPGAWAAGNAGKGCARALPEPRHAPAASTNGSSSAKQASITASASAGPARSRQVTRKSGGRFPEILSLARRRCGSGPSRPSVTTVLARTADGMNTPALERIARRDVHVGAARRRRVDAQASPRRPRARRLRPCR